MERARAAAAAAIIADNPTIEASFKADFLRPRRLAVFNALLDERSNVGAPAVLHALNGLAGGEPAAATKIIGDIVATGPGDGRRAAASSHLGILADELEQPNLPGTIDEHPNWRRLESPSSEQILGSARTQRILTAMREERPCWR